MNTIDETIFFGGCGLIGCCCFFRTITDRLIHSKFTKLLADTTFIVICNAVKMAYYDIPSLDTNFYYYFNVRKDSPRSLITKSYKMLLDDMDPLKYEQSEDSVEQYALFKYMYKLLSNPEKRDIYNRYNIYYGGVKGDIKDIIDPRTQEFDLIMHISLILLSWGLFIYIMTIPKAYQVARTWCTPLLFILVVLEIVFKLGDLEIPSILYQNATPPYMDSWTMILPSYLTEYELITYIYWNIPCIVLLSQCISAYGYVDPDECCHNVIKGLLKQQEINEKMLSYVHDTLALNTVFLKAYSESSLPPISRHEGDEEHDNEGFSDDNVESFINNSQSNLKNMDLKLAQNHHDAIKSHLKAHEQELLDANKSIMDSFETYNDVIYKNSNDVCSKYYWLIVFVVFGFLNMLSK